MRRFNLVAAALAASAAIFGVQAHQSGPAKAATKIETAPCSAKGVTDDDKALARGLSPKLKDGIDGYQVSCARAVVDQVKHRGFDQRAATIAVATTMVEGDLHNYSRAVDYDSVGLFQQRPSAGWGSVEQILDPAHATDAFLNRMRELHPHDGWKKEPMGEVAQRVQVSAFPDRYGAETGDAAAIVGGVWA